MGVSGSFSRVATEFQETLVACQTSSSEVVTRAENPVPFNTANWADTLDIRQLGG
jgi:hypothetical protein